MEIKLYKLPNPLKLKPDFFFDPVPEHGGEPIDGGSVTASPEHTVRTVIVPDGSDRVICDSGAVRLQTPDGRLFSANGVEWCASKRINGFSFAD